MEDIDKLTRFFYYVQSSMVFSGNYLCLSLYLRACLARLEFPQDAFWVELSEAPLSTLLLQCCLTASCWSASKSFKLDLLLLGLKSTFDLLVIAKKSRNLLAKCLCFEASAFLEGRNCSKARPKRQQIYAISDSKVVRAVISWLDINSLKLMNADTNLVGKKCRTYNDLPWRW